MHISRILSLGLLAGISLQVHAEGSFQAGLNQPLIEYPDSDGHELYVDVLAAGEVINIAVCGESNADDLNVVVIDPDGTEVMNTTLTSGNVDCADAFDAPLANPLRLVTTRSGNYQVRLSNLDATLFNRFDVSITPTDSVDPDPGAAGGRLWAYQWGFFTGSFSEQLATDADYFPLVPGGRTGTNYVWKLDLNKFSGNKYVLTANDLGVDAPNSGYSVPTSGNSVTPKFPIYLAYPAVAQPRPQDPPQISAFRFVDDAGQDYAISPGATPGVQDSGFFVFTADVDGTYSIVIDSNLDGVFGSGDKLLLGNAQAGVEQQVAWDGTDADGNTLPVGNYPARLQVRLGEYHFIADDAETSGGNVDGLTIFLANSDGSVSDTRVYWDDATFLGGTTTLPDGALSSTPEGHHSWGDFSSGGIGNQTYIDTYVYGLTSSYSALTAIAADDNLQTGVDAVLTAPAFATPGSTIAIQVEDADKNILPGTPDSVTVVVVNTQSGEQEQVTLLETGNDTGVFSADLATTDSPVAGTSNDGNLSVQLGQLLTLSYQDEPDAQGQSVTRQAEVQILNPNQDSDGDGILDGEEGVRDLDGDGVADYLDLDSDNDGLPDAIEQAVDSDGDGVADYRDLDSDNDGRLDLDESGADSLALDGDRNGRIDAVFTVGANGLADAVETSADSGNIAYNGGTPLETDGDGVFDFRDLDSDNDGIPDVIEAGGSDADADGRIGTGAPVVDENGLPAGAGLMAPDSDSDGIPDPLDLDSDGDGLYDLVEAGGSDADGDGLVDGFTDADGNGFDDGIEGTGLALPDSDGDGVPDYRQNDDPDGDGVVNADDLDDDNDGIPDLLEGDGAVDSDGDGIADSFDLDSDNDGLFDLAESGADAASLDGDRDGRIDGSNPVGANGLADAVETAVDSGQIAYHGGSLLDSDADAVEDFRDLDSDNDGIPDVSEAGGSDPDQDGWLGSGMPVVDGAGVPAGGGLDAPDTDGDGIVDPRDRDSDGDGLLDLLEAGGSDVDGNGIVDGFVDGNGDGLDDNIALAALPRPDSDGDGIPDDRDLDSDNDGIHDVIEAGGSDPDRDGRVGPAPQQVDELGIEVSGALTTRDTDGDGVADPQDLDSDNDGIPDVLEAGGTDPDGDGVSGSGVPAVNSDGVVDGGPFQPVDTDADGMLDPYDLDADGDGLSDLVEAGRMDANGDGLVDGFVDNNGDGFDDQLATQPLNLPDSDGDGRPDFQDSDDIDNDGIRDDMDLDDDNDGIPDSLEGDGAVDSDGDGVADSQDLDSDNDGLSDLAESGVNDPQALDGNADGRIDGSHPVGANGLADAVETSADSGDIGYNGGQLRDSDGDGVFDFRDRDSDNDGIPDVLEAGGDDPDADGIIGSGVPAVDLSGMPTAGSLQPRDTDGDGLPDQLDRDADGDGRSDLVEAGGADSDGDGRIDNFVDANGDGFSDNRVGQSPDGDTDQDGIPDWADSRDDRGEIKTALDGIGAFDGLLLLPLLLLALLRGSFRARRCLAAALLLAFGFQASAQTVDETEKVFYLGGGIGWSKMDPDTSGSIYSVADDDDSAWRLYLGVDLKPKLSLEAAVSDLGRTTLTPNGRIKYRTVSLDLLYYFLDQDRPDHVGWAAYAKAGLGNISNSANVPYRHVTSLQIALGLGAEYAWSNGFALRADLESFDKDAANLTLGLLYRFGKQRKAAPPAQPEQVVVQEVAVVEETVAVEPAVVDTDGDGVPDAQDLCPQTPAGAEVQANGCAQFQARIEGVHFETGSARLTAESRSKLDQVADTLKRFPAVRIEVQAHTDSRGNEASNLKLSQARARSVVEYLVSRGVSADRLVAKGYGESRPIADNATPEGRASNRRVEFRVLEGEVVSGQ